MVCPPCLLAPLLAAGSGAAASYYGKKTGENLILWIGIILLIIGIWWFLRNQNRNKAEKPKREGKEIVPQVNAFTGFLN